jgi:hypothetical protein
MLESPSRMTGTAATSQPVPPRDPHANQERKRRPVFVVGCHRSGTNLLYDTLLSAGGFAVYRGYLPVYESLLPHFGSLANRRNREKTVATWIRSKGFRRSGLEAEPLTSKLLTECRSGGDFIRMVMDAIAEQQAVQRWAVYAPDNVLHLDQIRREIPGALFVHIIRDGRDIALSLMKMEGFRPFPWSRRSRGLLETALYWQWMVCHGRQSGSRIPNDYLEVHYEALVTQPRTVLARLRQFLEHDLDYDRIQSVGLGRLRESNSSFLGEGNSTQNPVNRWKERLSPPQVAELEASIGATLEEFGYPLMVNPEQRRISFSTKCLAALYPSFLNSKQWIKVNTPIGRLSNLTALEVQPSAADAD